MDALLLGCRDEDENIQLACADCIGAVGAVDPGHLSWRELQSSKYFGVLQVLFLEMVNFFNCKFA
jgi:hypothetical protein